MSFFKSLDIGGSALTAQRLRMDILSQNISNATTTRTAEGGPYRRKQVIFEERLQNPRFEEMLSKAIRNKDISPYNGVRVQQIVEDESEFRPIYNPNHPDANEEGYVLMPNVNTAMEIVDLMDATRAYEANLTAINAVKSMAVKALSIGR